MKFLITYTILSFIAVSAIAREYRYSHYNELGASIEPVYSILILRFEVREQSIKVCLEIIEQLAKENDPTKKGISIYIPQEFKEEFSSHSQIRFTLMLGPNIPLISLFTEFGPIPWIFFPVTSREFAYIPYSAVIQDIDDNTEQGAAANP